MLDITVNISGLYRLDKHVDTLTEKNNLVRKKGIFKSIQLFFVKS